MAVTVSEIEAAYNALKAEGKETTARAVRARLGDRGSLGTINPVVSRLNAQNTGTSHASLAPLTIDSIPQAVVDRANSSVLNLVGEIMQLANDNSEQRVQDANQREAQAVADKEAVEEQNRQYETKVDELDEKIRELTREISQLTTSLALETQAREKAEKEYLDLKEKFVVLETSGRQAVDEASALKPQVQQLTTAKEYLEQKTNDQGNEIQRLQSEVNDARADAGANMKEALRLTGELAAAKAERDALQVQNATQAQDLASRSQESDRQRALIEKLIADQAASNDRHAEQMERLTQSHFEMMERLLTEIFPDRPGGEPSQQNPDIKPLNGHNTHAELATDGAAIRPGVTPS